MALAQSIQPIHEGRNLQSVSRGNVLAFPPPRALLTVTLPRESADRAQAPLCKLLHSPLGVYVISTALVRNEVQVQLDIAPEDYSFTVHTLIASVAAATIGPLKRRHSIGNRTTGTIGPKIATDA
jgi:hypothetical protein